MDELIRYAVDAIAIAIIIQQTSGILPTLILGAKGSDLVNTTNGMTGRPPTAPPAAAWGRVATSIGFIGVGGFSVGF